MRIRWNHGLQLIPMLAGRQSVSPAYSPFWNVRASPSALYFHAGWGSAGLWCALHQIVLD